MEKRIHFNRYKPKNSFLNNYIRHIWILESEVKTKFTYDMLPSTNIDIIFDFSNSNYNSTVFSNSLKEAFISSINEEYYTINFDCKLKLIGILFYPGMAHTLLKKPLSDLKKLIDLNGILNEFIEIIQEKTEFASSNIERIHIIEKELIRWINPEFEPNLQVLRTLEVFKSNNISINKLCNQLGMNRRMLERHFNTFIGISPRRYQLINRMQDIIVAIISQDHFNLYDGGYYDQSHFIRDFKNFTGKTPGQFYKKRSNEKRKNIRIKSALDIYDSPYYL